MSDVVWISCALADTMLYAGLDTKLSLTDLSKAGEICGRHKRGETLDFDEIPKELYVDVKSGKIKRLTYIFFGGGIWCVSVAAADVLKQFDLGTGGLVPIKIFQHDRVTPVVGEYYCLNFGAYKNAFLPEQSTNVRRAWEDAYYWDLPTETEHEQIAVSNSALAGADLWMDPAMDPAFFVSDRLAQALMEAKVANLFAFRRCRMIEEMGNV